MAMQVNYPGDRKGIQERSYTTKKRMSKFQTQSSSGSQLVFACWNCWRLVRLMVGNCKWNQFQSRTACVQSKVVFFMNIFIFYFIYHILLPERIFEEVLVFYLPEHFHVLVFSSQLDCIILKSMSSDSFLLPKVPGIMLNNNRQAYIKTILKTLVISKNTQLRLVALISKAMLEILALLLVPQKTW